MFSCYECTECGVGYYRKVVETMAIMVKVVVERRRYCLI